MRRTLLPWTSAPRPGRVIHPLPRDADGKVGAAEPRAAFLRFLMMVIRQITMWVALHFGVSITTLRIFPIFGRDADQDMPPVFAGSLFTSCGMVRIRPS